jgi:hypothetical protein
MATPLKAFEDVAVRNGATGRTRKDVEAFYLELSRSSMQQQEKVLDELLEEQGAEVAADLRSGPRATAPARKALPQVRLEDVVGHLEWMRDTKRLYKQDEVPVAIAKEADLGVKALANAVQMAIRKVTPGNAPIMQGPGVALISAKPLNFKEAVHDVALFQEFLMSSPETEKQWRAWRSSSSASTLSKNLEKVLSAEDFMALVIKDAKARETTPGSSAAS